MDPNWKKTNVVDGVFIARVEDLPYGTYAVSVLDDANSNLEMDMFLGIPKEGWGIRRAIRPSSYLRLNSSSVLLFLINPSSRSP